jgi:phospholipase C
VFDHTSVLRLIEWRWRLPPLSVRDANAHNLAYALDLDDPRPDFGRHDVPPFVSAGCTPATPATSGDDEWSALAEVARRYGFEVG